MAVPDRSGTDASTRDSSMSGGRTAVIIALGGVAAVLIPAGITWLIVVGLSDAWAGGMLPGALIGLFLFVRIIAFFAMLIPLRMALRAVFGALTSAQDTVSPNTALTFYALVVVYAAFGTLIPNIALTILFFEPVVYLLLALLMLIAARVGALSTQSPSGGGAAVLDLSRPNARRATRLTLLAVAAMLAASVTYGWLAIRGDVMDCFVRECSSVQVLSVVGLLSGAGIVTAAAVLWSLRTRTRVTPHGVIVTTVYGCLALIALALPVSTLMPYDFFVVGFWHGLAALALMVCQSRLENDPWPLPTHLVMDPWESREAVPR